jgi:hypothetical protein
MRLTTTTKDSNIIAVTITPHRKSLRSMLRNQFSAEFLSHFLIPGVKSTSHTLDIPRHKEVYNLGVGKIILLSCLLSSIDRGWKRAEVVCMFSNTLVATLHTLLAIMFIYCRDKLTIAELTVICTPHRQSNFFYFVKYPPFQKIFEMKFVNPGKMFYMLCFFPFWRKPDNRY